MINIFNGKKLLFIGAHVDDIEIGNLGLLQNLKRDLHPNKKNYFLILGEDDPKDIEISKKILSNFTEDNINYLNNDTLFFERNKIKENILNILKNIDPDYIFFHSSLEKHWDHQVVNNVVNEIARPLQDNNLKGLVEYFIPLNSNINLDYFNYCCGYSTCLNNSFELFKYSSLEKFNKLKSTNDRRGINFIRKFEDIWAQYNGYNGLAEAFKIKKFR